MDHLDSQEALEEMADQDLKDPLDHPASQETPEIQGRKDHLESLDSSAQEDKHHPVALDLRDAQVCQDGQESQDVLETTDAQDRVDPKGIRDAQASPDAQEALGHQDSPALLGLLEAATTVLLLVWLLDIRRSKNH
jgi:hypothetical protein